MSAEKANQFPITIAEWPVKRDAALFRVALDRFHNTVVVDMRCWRPDTNGVLRRGEGVTLAVKHLLKLVVTLAEALQRAKSWGVIEPVAPPERETPEVKARPRGRQRRTPGV